MDRYHHPAARWHVRDDFDRRSPVPELAGTQRRVWLGGLSHRELQLPERHRQQRDRIRRELPGRPSRANHDAECQEGRLRQSDKVHDAALRGVQAPAVDRGVEPGAAALTRAPHRPSAGSPANGGRRGRGPAHGRQHALRTDRHHPQRWRQWVRSLFPIDVGCRGRSGRRLPPGSASDGRHCASRGRAFARATRRHDRTSAGQWPRR